MAIASNSSNTATRGAWLVRLVLVAAVLGGFLFVALIWINTLGNVRGEEFSPDTFGRRTFQYQEIPWFGWRIGSVWHEDVSGPLEQHLQSDADLLPKAQRDPPPWDVIHMVRGAQSYAGDAEILKRYLTAGEEDSPSWLEWTNKHGELAKILWPAVAQAARSGQYTRIPDLFEAAEQLTVAPDSNPTPDDLRQALQAKP